MERTRFGGEFAEVLRVLNEATSAEELVEQLKQAETGEDPSKLAEAVLRIFPLLGEALPLAALAVRELDLARRSVETLPEWMPAGLAPKKQGGVGPLDRVG